MLGMQCNVTNIVISLADAYTKLLIILCGGVKLSIQIILHILRKLSDRINNNYLEYNITCLRVYLLPTRICRFYNIYIIYSQFLD